MTAGPGQIPRRIKKRGTGFKGLSMRELLIVCLGLPVALLAGLGLTTLPLWLRAGLAVLVAGVTLALAFGTHHGRSFEQWIAYWVAHRLRPRRMAWRRGGRDAVPPVSFEPPERAAVPAPAPASAAVEVEERQEAAAGGRVSLIFALVNAVMLAAMTCLTVYLADGGAEELKLWLLYKLR
jgi:hypothetical protein